MSHQHWTNYWQSGVQTSLPQDFKNNYDGEIYDIWNQVVGALASGSKVTDLCTGNGAVALILAEIALQQNKTLQITAVDISQINVKSILQKNPTEKTDMIKFISATAIEQLDSVLSSPQDAIVSQFGLEYSDLRLTAKALKQCLKPQGQLSFIAHSHESAVFSYMGIEQSIYNWLHQIGIFHLIEAFIQGSVTANGLKNKLLTIVQNNQPDHEFMSHELLKSWQSFITQILKQPNHQINKHKHALNEYLSQHKAAWKRLEDMLYVSSKVVKADWYQPLIDVGFSLNNTEQLRYKKQHVVGQFYDFTLI